MKLNIKAIGVALGLFTALASTNAQAVVHFDIKGRLSTTTDSIINFGGGGDGSTGLYFEIAGTVTDGSMANDMNGNPVIGVWAADSGTTFTFYSDSVGGTNAYGTNVFSADGVYVYQDCGALLGTVGCFGISESATFGPDSVGLQSFLLSGLYAGDPNTFAHVGQDLGCDGVTCVTVETSAPLEFSSGAAAVELNFDVTSVASYSIYEVPEPATLLLLGLGLAGLGVARSRRTNNTEFLR